MIESSNYDVIVIGSGAGGMIASITAKKSGKSVLLLEKLPNLGAKLKATGGGRCNLSNTLDSSEFMNSFGRNGKFMSDALNLFDYKSLIQFFKEIGVETHIPDGFRIFPTTHNSTTILKALESELKKLNIEILCNTRVQKLISKDSKIEGVITERGNFYSSKVIVATGGLGYPMLGTEGDGFEFAKELGHKVSNLYPAMLPLITKEKWVANCKADTVAKAQIKIDLPKAIKLKAIGDIIFTQNGIRGPVVLDFAREVTPFLDKYKEVPILLNLTKGMRESDIYSHFKREATSNPEGTILEHLNSILPKSIAIEICKLSNADIDSRFKKLNGEIRDKLIKTLAFTPLTIVGSAGFEKAMITRGGVSLKEINPKTMQSKIIDGLYFCGEVVDLDGPCGGYNLQWAFSSGYLAGKLFSI